MEVGMSLNPLVRLPLPSNSSLHSNSRRITTHKDDSLMLLTLKQSSLFCHHHTNKTEQKRQVLVVRAGKGKRGMQARQFQRPPPPSLPKIEEDGNPRFVIFIRAANVFLWYPLSLITGGTTAKIMVAAKDNFLGKYIYKDTIARNLAAVIYKDEKGLQQTAFRQFRVLRSAKDYRYGYKLVENNNLKVALSSSDVIELPTEAELKTVLDKVKDFFGDAASGAKESFGKLTALNSLTDDESKEQSEVKS
eukprot:TRINITY_DN513_c0_g1_i1.p1 TRINITY_DN513_c0_g1~~TRINITY_DN513_c0_g1_i1.p1  ORF type:complete len:248 (+),score=41.17 TRINITY_DN513_c0_g1_i1:54-797(+)